MTDARLSELIQADIDGELDAPGRAEFARRLLADPDARTERDELRRMCETLDTLPLVEPPEQLREEVLAALPQATAAAPVRAPRQTKSFVHRWRYAAMIAAVVGAGTLVLETVRAPGPVAGDAAGTMAATGAVLDTAHFSALLSGDVTLYRDGSGAGLRVDLAASSPVEVVVVTGTQKINVHGAGLPGGGGIRTTVLLPDASRTVELTFLMGGREVGRVTLHANGAH